MITPLTRHPTSQPTRRQWLSFSLSASALAVVGCRPQSQRQRTAVPFAVERGLACGPRLGADLYLPEAPRQKSPWIVVFHGGGWQFFSRGHSHARAFASMFARNGHPTLVVDYPGAESTYPAHVDYVAETLEWLQQSGRMPPNTPVVLAGISSGAQMATLAALDRRILRARKLEVETSIAGVIAFTGVFEMPLRRRDGRPYASRIFEKTFGDDPAAMCDASPLRHLRADMPPTLIVSGRYEPEPLRLGAWTFANAARRLGADVELIPDMPTGHLLASYHVARNDREPWARAMFSFLNRVATTAAR